MNKITDKHTSLAIIEKCKDEKEKKKLECMFDKKFRHLPDENEYMFDMMELEKVKTDTSLDDDAQNTFYYDFVRKHFSNTLDKKTLALIKRGGLDERQFQIKRQKENMLRCESCNSENNFSCTKQNLVICADCGFCLDAMITVPSWQQEKDLPKKKSGYTKQKTMSEALDYFLCRKKCTVNNETIMRLRCKLEHICIDHLTIKMLKSAMKELGMNKVYIQMYLLFHQLTAKKVVIDPDTEKIVHYLFYLVKNAFSDLRDEKVIERTNIFIYKYSIFKILEIIIYFVEAVLKNQVIVYLSLNEEKKEGEFNIFGNILTREKLRKVDTAQLKQAINMIPYPVIESQENLIKYDQDWKQICKRCTFPFFESL
jgi:ribosomal protein L37E